MTKPSACLIAALAVCLSYGTAFAAEPGTATVQVAQRGGPGEGPIFGGRLMTEEEREAYRERMRNAASPEERETIRAEHHEQMMERARERGESLAEEPPAGRGPGMGRGMGGPGTGMGPGMGGPGRGMGSGMGGGMGGYGRRR